MFVLGIEMKKGKGVKFVLFCWSWLGYGLCGCIYIYRGMKMRWGESNMI